MAISETVTIAVVGDIQLHGSYQDAARTGQAHALFAELRELLADADVVVGDLETVLMHGGTPRADKLCLQGAPMYAGVLRDAGLNLVTVANNHLLDYGPEGLVETLAHLAAAGIHAVGGGVDAAAAIKPVVIERNGVRLGLLGACHPSTRAVFATNDDGPGVAPMTEEVLWPAIDALKPCVDRVILLLHWGLEYSHVPTPEQVAFAHAAIDRGVSVILGDHSHALQGIEHYGNGLIAYSLGNLTDAPVDWQGPTRHYQCGVEEVDRESILLKLCVSKEHVELRDPVPLWLDDAGRPTAAAGQRAKKILEKLAECSAMLSDRDLERYWQETVIGRRVAEPLANWWREGSLWDKVRNFRPGQLVSAWLLLKTWMTLKFSRSEARWQLFNPRNDTRPMPSARRGRVDD
jgi:poly-gamma-glutamate synthesis protein (capsule biosynthesis protein)